MNIMQIHNAHALSVLIIMLVLNFSCASTGADLVEQGKVITEHVPSHYAHIHRVTVYQKKTEFIISGELYERTHQVGFVPGHVDIEVVSIDGKMLQQGHTNYHRIGRGKSGKFKFSRNFPGAILQGSRIRIVHHPVPLQQAPPEFLHHVP